jgi:hypothetical protein
MNALDIACFGADIAEASPLLSVTTDVLCAVFGVETNLAEAEPLLAQAISDGYPDILSRELPDGDILFDLGEYGSLVWHAGSSSNIGLVTYLKPSE